MGITLHGPGRAPRGAFQRLDFAADRKRRHGKMNGKGTAARVVRRTLAVSSRGERMRARRLLDGEATHPTRRTHAAQPGWITSETGNSDATIRASDTARGFHGLLLVPPPGIP